MLKKIAASVIAFSPLVAFAQYAPSQGIHGLFLLVQQVLNWLVPIFIALAVVWLIWNVFQYTIAADPEKKKESTGAIVWGIVGIFVMVSIWGLVAILQSTFGTSGVQSTVGNPLPQIQ